MRWEVIAAVAALCIALRVAAPLLLHGRQLPPAVEARLNGAIVPLLGALIAIQLFVHEGQPAVDAALPASVQRRSCSSGGGRSCWRCSPPRGSPRGCVCSS